MRRVFVTAIFALVALASSRAEAASIVLVWGEEITGSTRANINNFYNGIADTTSTLAGGQLDALDLTGVDLLWATQPADDYTAAELTTMANFLSGGGRLAFLGEHGTFAPFQNTRINTALSALGANISINNVTIDPGFRTASVGDGQILAHPLTAGVNTYQYAAFAPLTVSGSAQALMLGEALNTVMMAYQNIGPGSIFLITDQNVWDGQPSGWPGFNNATMFENLLLGDTVVAPVPEPASMALMGVGLVGVALARLRSRRRN